MILGSTSTNIHILSLFSGIISILGLTNIEIFTLYNITIAIISFYILNIFGVWMTLHRYYSHRTFEFRYSVLKWIFTLLSVISGRGSPLGWVYLHRLHHAYSDTEKDPHAPTKLGYKILGFKHYQEHESNKMKVFLVKDMMTREHLFLHKWYMIIILFFMITFSLISFELTYFMWILPMFLIQISTFNFNYFGHTFGYRNFNTDDNSKNNFWLFLLLLGEAWHNNHHKNPRRLTTTIKKFELDPLAKFIEILKVK